MTIPGYQPGRTGLARLVCAALVVGGLLSLYRLQQAIDQERSSIEARQEEILFLPSGGMLRRFSGGYSGLIADIYWTRAVQYYGRRRLAHARNYALLGNLLTMATDLDPNLLIAYRFGSLFLAAKPPEGAGRPDQAIHLLERGIVANPTYWRLWQDLGFIYYWDLKDYAHAAAAFRAGSEEPGALPWMKALAASVAAQGGELETSYRLWSEIARSAENDAMRRSAILHLEALKTQSELNKLDSLLALYRQQQGRDAHSMQDLIAAGMLKGYALDASGTPFVIGPDGQAHLGPKSKIDLGLLQ
jgi:tetratricopeptide (TPR) repeat protein